MRRQPRGGERVEGSLEGSGADLMAVGVGLGWRGREGWWVEVPPPLTHTNHPTASHSHKPPTIPKAYAAITDMDISEATQVPVTAATATHTAPDRGMGSATMGGSGGGGGGEDDPEARLRKRFTE